MSKSSTPTYLCQSYYDDNNVLRDCTCSKCGKYTYPQGYRAGYKDATIEFETKDDPTPDSLTSKPVLRGKKGDYYLTEKAIKDLSK